MSILPSLLLNFTLLITLAHVCATAFTVERGASLPLRHSLLGLLSALMLIGFPGHSAEGYPLDLRLIPPAFVMMGFGPRYAVPVYLVLLVSGLLCERSVLSVPVVGAALTLGLAWLFWHREQSLRWKVPQMLAYAVACTVPVLLRPGEPLTLAGDALPLLGVNVLSFVAVSWVLTSRLRLIQLTWKLRDLANTDLLTGLSNRRLYERDLRRMSVGSHLILLDLDHFKRVNDTYGHATGDEALKVVGALLGSMQTEHLRAYRIGGEEFAVILEGSTERVMEDLAHTLLDRIRVARVTLPAAAYASGDRRRTLRLTSSIGVASLGDPRDHIQMFRRADEALHQSKEEGRDRVTLARAASSTSPPVATPAAPLSASTTTIEVRPGQGGRHALMSALLDTLTELNEDRDLTPDDYQRLLESGILAVPGAEAGTVTVLDHGGFRIVAQLGFRDEILGNAFGPVGQRDWYGGRDEDYLTGRPRILTDVPSRQPHDHRLVVCNINGIRANICVPVVVGGQVIAQLNLDNLERTDAFGAESLDVARLFGRQMSALLSTQQLRHERVALQRTLSDLHALAAALQTTPTRTAAVTEFAEHLCASFEGDGVQVYELGALGLDVIASSGVVPPQQRSLLPGSGVAWTCVQERRPMLLPAVRADEPGYAPAMSGPQSLLLLPLHAHTPADAEPNASGAAPTWGLLAITRPATRPFTPTDQGHAQRFAELLGTALARIEPHARPGLQEHGRHNPRA
ncbi:diguanylate cyclase [Deinococcus aquiradiocola]|uniref:GGDEF domain-containing protein n=1 Tax=Deinococcus aquiradiocola TaxID=393059 RepID=A0A917UKP7_9DEIO|nr:diguanylate cyclase [Deinococcus aquiradiocola]GGJ64203.1 hypothetical protein GCM10008939_05120 [Deinococcus aquiradiocola]